MLFINNLNAVHKLLISLVLGFIVYVVTLKIIPGFTVRFLDSWNAFCLIFLSLNWITFWTVSPRKIRQEAAIQNVGKIVVFVVSLGATFVALTAAMQLLLDKSNSIGQISFALGTAIMGLILSWILVHSIFAMRYAHLFYSDDETDKNKHLGGLDFPDEKHPDFIDFAYYSFVIGMTFQVSDVTVTAKVMRRLTLFHSLLAFAFNTIIVALTVNIIAGLSK